MLAGERVLLYSLSLALGALRVRELSQPATMQIPASPAASGQVAPWHLIDPDGKARFSASLDSAGAPRLVMYDAQGRPGVELKLSGDGNAQLNLSRDAS